jgi:Mg2+/citrate symporter
MSGHGAHADPNDPFQKRAAVAIAVFTVILAFANMLTNQARTRAILSSNRATNQWSYYQSKSTKLLITQLRRDAVKDDAKAAGELDAELSRYEKEKEEISKKARGLEHDEADSEHKEHYYEYSATVVELAIVIAGIALLLSARKLLLASALVAAFSLALVCYTSFALGHATEVESKGEPAESAEKPAT